MQVKEGNIEDWKKAGKIGSEALRYGMKLIKPGVGMLEVTEKVEQKIFDMGGELAFPTQINFNEIAAHDCAHTNDDRVFNDGDVLKIDVGVHVNGAIADNAGSVNLGDYDDLVKATREALNAAIKVVRPGATTGEIGRVVGETIQSYGFNPVKNLCGHGTGIFKFHMPPTIPNFDSGSTYVLKEGQTIAIEPFATDGVGMIKEHGASQVFSVTGKRPVRNTIAREVLNVMKPFGPMPFCIRHLTQELSLNKVAYGLRELQRAGVVTAYPPLKEVSDGMVTQAEHSIGVFDKPIVFTNWDQ